MCLPPFAGPVWRSSLATGTSCVVVLLLTALAAGANPVAGQILSPGKLASAHTQLEGLRNCTACHELGTRGISQQKCLDCHEPLARRIRDGRGYHAGVSGACADCHKDHLGPDFDLRHLDENAFAHDETGYALELSHAEVECRECHQPSRIVDTDVRETKSEHGALTRTFLGLGARCVSCHATETPHGDQFSGRACADCHDAGDWTDPAPFDHDRARFRLDGLHVDAACSDCHEPAGDPASVRYRPIPFGSCADCHEDPHAGAMTGSCASCHATQGWTVLDASVLDGRFDHARTGFRLLGAHAAVDCSSCHRPGRPPRSDLIEIRYVPGTAGNMYPRPRADTCGSCHIDRHALPGDDGRWSDCTLCHSEARWAPSAYGVGRHAESTFPLTGAHVAVPCFACHQEPSREHDRFTLGLGASACQDCHAEESPHEGVYGERACEACHVTDGFDRVAFDHEGVDTSPVGAICATCHAADDPHEGQFPERSCAACHGTEFFTPVAAAFDHAATVFPLEGAHEAVACAACHVTEQGSGGWFTRYRPIGTDCVDCHGGSA